MCNIAFARLYEKMVEHPIAEDTAQVNDIQPAFC